jgi:hypothetical protein
MQYLNKESATDELEDKVSKLEKELEEYKSKYQLVLDKYNVQFIRV